MTNTMIDFGRTLRTAREAKGLTIKQLADQTKVMETILANLEDERFDKIVAPIYGRGFVKLYCEAVGLDPKPLISEFMDIYNGNREPSIRERDTISAPATPIPAAISASATPIPAEETISAPTFAPEAPINQAPSETLSNSFHLESEAIDSSTLPTPDDEVEAAPIKREHPFARYASPINDRMRQLPALPANTWRIVIIAAILLFLIWGVVISLKALYKATTKSSASSPATAELAITEPASAPQTAITTTEKPKSDVSAPMAEPIKRTPRKIEPLYID